MHFSKVQVGFEPRHVCSLGWAGILTPPLPNVVMAEWLGCSHLHTLSIRARFWVQLTYPAVFYFQVSLLSD